MSRKPLRTIDKIGLVVLLPIAIAVTVTIGLLRSPPSITEPGKPETAITLCIKQVQTRPINPKAAQELEDNAFIISRFLKHPDDLFLLKQVQYELPGLLYTGCYGTGQELISLIVRTAAAGHTEQAQVIIQHQIYAYARK
jgi:hypothetical protein